MEIDVGSLRCMAPSLGIPPSRHYDPSDAEDAALRLDWAKFLFRAGYRLRYPQETTGTAVLLFHRFLIQERVGKHQRSRDVILTTCLFLAGKVTEAPRRLRDVINVLHMLTCTGQDEPPLLDKAYWTMKERIVEFEQVLLRTINFQVDPPDPYRLILNYARSLRLGRAATRTAWGLANDVLFCPRALSTPPPAVACAAIRMAARVHGADRRLCRFSPPIRKKRRRANNSGGFGGGGEAAVGSGDGGAGGAGGIGGGSGGGGGGGNEEQDEQAEREMGGDGRGGTVATTATPAAAATAAGEGAPVARPLRDSGDHNSFVAERVAAGTGEGLGVGAGAGGGSETTVEKSGCPPRLGADEDKSAGERKGGQQIVPEPNAAADDVVFVGGNGSSVTGGGGSGGGSGGAGGGVSGGDGGKDDEREIMPWWGLFDARDEEIELVCSELLALYRTHDAKGGGKGIGGNGGVKGIGGNGSITGIGGRPDGGGGGSGADRGVTSSRRRDGDGAEGRGGVGVGDGSRVNGLGGGVGVRGVIEHVSSVSSANSSRRRNGSRQ